MASRVAPSPTQSSWPPARNSGLHLQQGFTKMWVRPSLIGQFITRDHAPAWRIAGRKTNSELNKKRNQRSKKAPQKFDSWQQDSFNEFAWYDSKAEQIRRPPPVVDIFSRNTELGTVVYWKEEKAEKAFGVIESDEGDDPTESIYFYPRSFEDDPFLFEKVEEGDQVTYFKDFNEDKDRYEASRVHLLRGTAVKGDFESNKTRQDGIVASWYKRGFGYIKPHVGGPKLFCHASQVMDAHKRLRKGAEVTFRKVFNDRNRRYDCADVFLAHVEATFAVGDRVENKISKKRGTVVGVDDDGDPEIRMYGEETANPKYGKDFVIVEKAIDADLE